MRLFPMRTRSRMLRSTIVAAMVCGFLAPAVGAQAPPELPARLATLARQLESVPLLDDRADTTPDPTPGDPHRPAVGLRAAMAALARLQRNADRPTAAALRTSTELVQEAWHQYAAGSRDLSHLTRSLDALRRTQAALHSATARSATGAASDIREIQSALSSLAQRMASDVLQVAEKSGASRELSIARRSLGQGEAAVRRGEHTAAVAHFGNALKAAAGTITFDVALFEQNIASALNGQTIGHAFSIANSGLLYQGGEGAGLARTAADLPVTAQSPNKEMHVASVSKTLTTIVTLHLLDELGLTPDAFVAPYLPGNWALGAGVEALRFRDFMTHTSGFGQIDAGNTYESLQTAIATDVGSTSFSYRNANFGLMRVLVAGLLGIDPVDYGEFDAGALTTAAFLLYAQDLYDSIGVDIDCAPSDDTPTVQYKFPDDGTSGYVEPDRQLTCGGYGWFISANELAAVLTHLRNTEHLLSDSARSVMQEEFLGFMDPANYGFIDGAFGIYYMHGGDWYHGSGELHSCVMAFPITVEASLVINSARGAMPYQCALLQSAFDSAWVAP